MSWSIRTHLTILIVVVFLCIFLFLFLAGGTALYLSLNHATDKNLATEEKRLAEMVNSEFYALVVAKTDTQKTLSEEFVDLAEKQLEKDRVLELVKDLENVVIYNYTDPSKIDMSGIPK